MNIALPSLSEPARMMVVSLKAIISGSAECERSYRVPFFGLLLHWRPSPSAFLVCDFAPVDFAALPGVVFQKGDKVFGLLPCHGACDSWRFSPALPTPMLRLVAVSADRYAKYLISHSAEWLLPGRAASSGEGVRRRQVAI